MIGVLNINKPSGVTSRYVVNKVCAAVPRKTKVGHCGTLDPIATGVLIVCVGPATRLIKFAQEAEKVYEGEFQFGLTSDTEDISGDVKEVPGPTIEKSEVEAVLKEFTGTIEQLPPSYSALRVNGKRAYELARAGKDVTLKPRPVQIFELKLTQFDWPMFRLSMRCGSGTYVRSLGRDIALRLGTHAVMTTLERKRIGYQDVQSAIELDAFNRDPIEDLFLPTQSLVCDMPHISIEDEEIIALSDGQPIERKFPGGCHAKGEIVGIDQRGRMIAVLQPWRYDYFTPKINFSKYWRQRSTIGP